MSAAAFLAARGWSPHHQGGDWWQVLVPSGRGRATPLFVPQGEMERLAEDLGWNPEAKEETP